MLLLRRLGPRRVGGTGGRHARAHWLGMLFCRGECVADGHFYTPAGVPADAMLWLWCRILVVLPLPSSAISPIVSQIAWRD
jgi:hypothetical protein